MKSAVWKQIRNFSGRKGMIAVLTWGMMAILSSSVMARENTQEMPVRSEQGEQILVPGIQELGEARQKALDAVQKLPPEKAGEVVSAYLTEALQMVEKMNLALQGEWSDRHQVQLRKWLDRKDLILQEQDGTKFLRLNIEAEVARFRPWLSPDWQAYFQWVAVENAQPALEDGDMMISWDDYRKRLIMVENLIREYPDFSQKTLLEKALQDKIWFYLNGTDNTQITADNGRVRPEILQSYRNFIREDQSSRYYPVVRQYYEMLKKNQFMPDRETADFAESVLQ